MAALPATKGELDQLRTIVERSLKDAATPKLSADARFIMAYDAARTLSLIVIRAAGHRPKGTGAHASTFAELGKTVPAFAKIADYFDGCRRKRNTSEYRYAGGVSDTDADDLLKEVRQFAVDAEAWVAAHHPHLA